jgi:hypothetical protein
MSDDGRPCQGVETPGCEKELPEVQPAHVSGDRSANRPARDQDSEPSEMTRQRPFVHALGEWLCVKKKAESCVLEGEER